MMIEWHQLCFMGCSLSFFCCEIDPRCKCVTIQSNGKGWDGGHEHERTYCVRTVKNCLSDPL